MDVQYHENGRVTLDFSDVLEKRIAEFKQKVDESAEAAMESELLKRGWANPKMHEELKARAASAKARHHDLARSVMEAAGENMGDTVPTFAYRLLEQQLLEERTRRLELQAMGSMYARELAKSSKSHHRKTRTIKRLQSQLEQAIASYKHEVGEPKVDSPAEAPQQDGYRLPPGFSVTRNGDVAVFMTPTDSFDFLASNEPDKNRAERHALWELSLALSGVKP